MSTELHKVHGVTPSMRMADLVMEDFSVLTVLYHFGMELGFGEDKVADICERYSVPQDIFLTVCRLYMNLSYVPDYASFTKDDLKVVADYVYKSHLHYRNEILVGVDGMVSAVLEDYGDMHRKILSKFYADYRSEVNAHFNYEENVVLPYVMSLCEGNRLSKFSISAFEDNHGDIEDKLQDLMNIIVKYLPGDASFSKRYALLNEISRLGDELNRHTFIENNLLVPLALKIEEDGE